MWTCPPGMVHGANKFAPSEAQGGSVWVKPSQSSWDIVPPFDDFDNSSEGDVHNTLGSLESMEPFLWVYVDFQV